MRNIVKFSCFLLLVHLGYGQKTIERTLNKFNKGTVPYLTVDELKESKELYLLDTRKKEEYDVSHLKNAIWVGHKEFSIDTVMVTITEKNVPILVYCSVGVRSENIGEKLLKAGYTDVKNLYGGLFRWKNLGNPVYDSEGLKTEKVHAFSKNWGKLLTNAEKVY